MDTNAMPDQPEGRPVVVNNTVAVAALERISNALELSALMHRQQKHGLGCSEYDEIDDAIKSRINKIK